MEWNVKYVKDLYGTFEQWSRKVWDFISMVVSAELIIYLVAQIQ